ncbi:MAG: regulator of cell morphogenesis and NO signaling [Cyclobacteriaceae bacterium]|jgi:regulator of cell morphogenesis and NO signaling
MQILSKKVCELVDENFIYGRALHYLGISFFDCENKTLREICEEKQIDHKRLLRSFYRFDSNARISLSEIKSFPIQLVVSYLRFSHQTYIKDSLPYIAELIQRLEPKQEAVSDLIAVFPDFVEDFIKHIYEEEDQLFGHIDRMVRSKHSHHSLTSIAMRSFQINLSDQQALHEEEDEMEALRSLLMEIKVDSLHLEVIKKEIQAFDRELLYHATIENEILFPKAIELESSVKNRIADLSRLN